VKVAVLAVADSVRLVLRARAQAILDPLDRAVYAVAGPLELMAQIFAVTGSAGRFHRTGQAGVWYASAALGTALAEVAFHQRRRLRASGLKHLTVRLVEARAALAGSFTDLCGAPLDEADATALDPDIGVGWPAGQVLADRARAQRIDGIVWPSMRDPDGGDAYAMLQAGGVRAPRWGSCWQVPIDAVAATPPTPTPDAPLDP
jgi:RES domain